MLPVADAQFSVVAGLVTEARGDLRSAMVGIGAQWAQFAGWLHLSAEQPDRAAVLFDWALEWAVETGDREMIATVLSFKGHAAWLAGQVGPLIGLTEAALRDQEIRSGVGGSASRRVRGRGQELPLCSCSPLMRARRLGRDLRDPLRRQAKQATRVADRVPLVKQLPGRRGRGPLSGVLGLPGRAAGRQRVRHRRRHLRLNCDLDLGRVDLQHERDGIPRHVSDLIQPTRLGVHTLELPDADRPPVT
jgi:hypothetical protein